MTKRETARHVAPGPVPSTSIAAPRLSADPTLTVPPLDLESPREDRLSSGTAFLSVGSQEPAEHLFRRLLGAYLAGAPKFVVRERPTLSTGTREVVRTFCRRTRQPEIVSEERDSIRLHDLSFESPVSLDQRVQRMGRLVLNFHREAVDAWSHLPLGDRRLLGAPGR